MTINLQMPDITELKPRITVYGVGGGGCNAVNNMIEAGLQGVEFVVANTDAQALTMSKADRLIQMGVAVTEGLGAGSQPEIGRAAAEEAIDEINDHLAGAHMVFITAGMGGGTGTGAAPVVARAAREAGILTVGVVTKPFQFEGQRRMTIAEQGIQELQKHVDTLIVIPNQNLFRIANEKTTFADAFAMADEVLYSGVACITDLMVKDGLINLDFADVRSVMREMGKAMMGTGEASGDKRAIEAAEAAISNPLLDDVSMQGAQGLLISITGGKDMTLFEVDEAASRVREEVDNDANIIFGATFDERLEGTIRVSVVATGIDAQAQALEDLPPQEQMVELTKRLKTVGQPGATNAAQMRTSGQRNSVDALEDELAVQRVAANGGGAPAQRRSPADPGVRIGPFRPDPSLVAIQREPVGELDGPVHSDPADGPSGPYIPPEAERPSADGPRMPKVEDF
ncbi:MAG TPA: cell division protein FtsZ, partial [Afifellaceae bacterium]|nr:cell division protein FtsZ [Afifellaceae bacterium]